MHFSTAIAAIAAVAPFASAHGNSPLPKIIGLSPRDLKARSLLSSIGARFAGANSVHGEHGHLHSRQTDGKECGAGVGSCAAGLCCSQSGYCGTTDDFCYSPGCDYKYGPGCPENQTPGGTNTSTVTRTKVGTVAYGGAGIYQCVQPGTVALTYDDGPQKEYTAHVLDVFANYPGSKATFFITGNNINKGQIDTTAEYVSVIKRMDSEGHQIASHTWTHLNLDQISSIDRKQQMWKNEMALRNIVGKIPTYMRPPYSACITDACEADMADLGYHVTFFDVDTDDYNQDNAVDIQKSKDWFKGNITKGNVAAASSQWLEIAHDIHYQTAYNLTDYMLSTLTSLGYKAVTVGECLGDPVANWYRTAGGAGTSTTTATSSAASPSATKVTTDGLCGSTSGTTCVGGTFGNCCSQYGYCGATTDHCGTGCQSGFGTCGSNTVSSTTTKSSSTSVSSTKASVSSTVSSTKTSSAAPTSTKAVSTDGLCGGTAGKTCQASTFGNCCSQYGYCGSTTDHCGTGCQSGFGTCSGSSSSASSVKPVTSSAAPVTSTVKPATSTVSSATPSATKGVSTDGTCGGTAGKTCSGSTFGNCCSQYGYCGATTGHCGTGCQSGFGTCTGSSAATTAKTSTATTVKTSTSAAAVATKAASKDGSCGSTNSLTCAGTSFGTCCSQYGYCGLTTTYCGTGCQKGYGTCT